MISIVGVDPGIKGGISLLVGSTDSLVVALTVPTPTKATLVKKHVYRQRVDEVAVVKLLSEWDATYQVDVVLLEKQIAISGQGLLSTSVTMEGYGIYKGLCAGVGIPYEVVAAQQWQSFYGALLGCPHETPKANSVAWCTQLLPQVPLTRTPRSKTKDHGLSDALLIGYYGMCKHEASQIPHET